MAADAPAASSPLAAGQLAAGPLAEDPLAADPLAAEWGTTLKFASHLAHLLVEAALGVLALLLLAVCVLAWRLAQGPIDLTWLMRREHALVAIPGAQRSLGSADLAWEGFSASNQPLVVRLRDVAVTLPGGGPALRAASARVRFSETQLLRGLFVPRAIAVEGLDVQLRRDAGGIIRLGGPGGAGEPLWPAALEQLSVQAASVTIHDAALGLDWRANDVALALTRAAGGGLAGQGQATLQAGDVVARLTAQAAPQGDTTRVNATLAAVNPAALAALSPRLGLLARVNAPVAATLGATLDSRLQPVEGRLDLTATAGIVGAGKGSVRLSSAAATLSVRPPDFRLDHVQIVLAPAGSSPGPVVSATGLATRAGGRVRATFGIDVDRVAMAELPAYWPAGTGGGARAWLTRNVTAGTVRQAHVAAGIDAPADLSDAMLTALSGGLSLDDATVWWLRPVPPVVHASARLAIEGPDALRIALQSGTQDRLALLPGSQIRITGLQMRDQFADIDARLAGPVADALALLDHPRLNVLSRGGVEIVAPAGAVRAQLTLRVPLEDHVTMDDVPVSATAALTGIHLGRLVAGRDLDQADLSAKVTGTGLAITGKGAVAGIPARLALEMDFRGGKPGQVLQHLTAQGTATPAQLLAAGLPAEAVHVITGGAAGLRVDYTSRRGTPATLQVDADLAQASVATALGWSKPAGQPAAAGGLVTLDHGRISGVDNLHAEGPGLAIVSHATVSPRARTLQLQRFDLGRTSAHGQIGFPARGDGPVAVVLSGQSLDLSAMFARNDSRLKSSAPLDLKPADDRPGLPWSAKLDFAKLFLAHDTVWAPLHLVASSDGRRILRASATAGAGLKASVTPAAGSRRVRVSATDAGGALAGFGIAGVSGGALSLDGSFDDARPGAPLTGKATIDNFNLRDAPAIGRLLQVMTLYGVADTLHGPGLHFSHLIAPFRWQRRVLHFSNARAFSPSLGLTAAGDFDLSARTADISGTVVPAYFFNQLLGDLPLIGRIFSPEKGGGLFAARYSVRGPFADPKVGINPLSALTPGFLRGVFGVFDRRPASTPESDQVQ